MRKTHPARTLLVGFLITAMLFVSFMEIMSYAADPVLLMPPQKYQVTDIGYVQNISKKDWYANLKWDAVSFPAEATEKYITLGFNEVETGTGKMLLDTIQIPLPGSATTQQVTEYSPDTIKHGTIYESYARGSYKIALQSSQYTVQSQKSNPVKFLTGLHVSVELIPGTNNIKIKWDDVWDTTGRINYRILISDTKGFTQPPPVPDIVASEIGKAGSPVVVNTSDKKLEFTYAFAQPGREYAIKVVPLPNNAVACATAEEIEAVSIKTDILLKAQKVGFTNNGDVIWKLFWNPIVKGNTFTRVDYELYRYTNSDLTGQLFRLIPEKDSYQITVAKNDTNAYSFKIDAKAYAPNSTTPVEFRSNARVGLKESIAQQPMAPELIDSFPSADPDPLVYDDLLTATKATIMWKVPYTGEGLVDTDITYDIYMVDDIRYVASPPDNFKIASDLSMGEGNEIRDKLSGKVIGYKYDLLGLTSNATYYFVIYAKKNFLVQSPADGFMITKPFVSKQTVKVIITRPDTGADRPMAPPSPPFRVKPGTTSVSYDEATLVLDKRWHALYNATTSKWEFATAQQYQENALLANTSPLKKEGMIVNYNPGWTVVPHVVSFNDALTAIRLRHNRTPEYIAYSDLTQSDILAFEIPQDEMEVPDLPADQNQTFDIKIGDLVHNTAYLVWITIENQNGTSSDPSDPIIITTPPQITEIPVTPTVPTDLKGIAADDFIDLFWTFKSGMDYEIRCGTSDNIESATIEASVSYQELTAATLYRLNGLKTDTLYYIWIRAISKAPDNTRLESEYSNPLIIKTEAYKPPAPPAGFGIKTGADGVTEKSITYLWEAKANFTYFLEFADNIEFNEATEYTVNGNTYTAMGLISNRRYYARLYALDNKTGLRSLPTGTIMVITNKSKNEYDASYDLDDIPTGDSLVVSPTVKDGVWSANSTGINAHRLAEQVRALNQPIVQIDLSKPPAKATTVRLDLGAVFIDALSERKVELYVKLPSADVIIRPDSLQNDEYFRLKNSNTNFSLRFESLSPAPSYPLPKDLKVLTPVTQMKVGAVNAATGFKSFAKPLRVDLPIAGISSYGASQINTYRYDDAAKVWSALPSTTRYETAKVSGELQKPGAFLAATRSVASTGTIPTSIATSLNNIQAVFPLKALSGKTFNHTADVFQSEIVKLLLDVVPSTYNDDDYLDKAVRSGIVSSFSEIADGSARRDKAIYLLVSFYRFKTRESVVPTNPTAWSNYTDFNKADAKYVNALKFAIENGITQGNGSTLIYPDRIVTYGEMVIMLEKILKLCGEL